MDTAQVRAVMHAVRDSLERKSGVNVGDDVLDAAHHLGRPFHAQSFVSGQGR